MQSVEEIEEVKIEQANKVETIKTAIANTLKEILSSPAGGSHPLENGTTYNAASASIPPSAQNNDLPKRRASNSNIPINDPHQPPLTQMPRHSTISNPVGTSNNLPPAFLNRTAQFQSNQRSGSVSDVSRDLFNSKPSKLNPDSEPLPLKSYKSSDDAHNLHPNPPASSLSLFHESISSLNDSLDNSHPPPSSLTSPRFKGFSHHRSSSLSSSNSIDSFQSIFENDSPSSSSSAFASTSIILTSASGPLSHDSRNSPGAPTNHLLDSLKDESLPTSSLSKSMSYNDALSSLVSSSGLSPSLFPFFPFLPFPSLPILFLFPLSSWSFSFIISYFSFSPTFSPSIAKCTFIPCVLCELVPISP